MHVSSQADAAGEQALVERLLAERGRDLRLGDQLQVDRQGADPQALGEVLGLLDVPDPVDLGAGAAVDALGVLAEVDRGQRDDPVVERDGEPLQGRLAIRAGREDHLGTALGDPLGDRGEGLAALVRELHRHDGFLGLLVGVLLGVLDVGARELRVVLDHEQPLHGLRLLWRALGLDDRDPLRHLQDLAAGRWAAPPLGILDLGGGLGVAHRYGGELVPALAVLGDAPDRALRALHALEVREQLLAARVGPGNEPAVLVEEVELVFRAVVALVVVGLDLLLVAVEAAA